MTPKGTAMTDRTTARHLLAAAGVLALAAACSTTTPQEEGADAQEPERGHAHADDLTVSGAWMPEPANPGVGALYLEIDNTEGDEDALTGVATSASETAELHTTEESDGGSPRMEEVEEIPVPAGEHVELTSGGYHVMVLDITEPLTEGDEFTADLAFDSGTGLELTVPVEAMADHGDGHGGEHDEDHGDH